MSGIDTRLWNLQDMLAGLGFGPESHAPGEYRELWYIKPVRDDELVRVVIFPDDGNRVEVFYLDAHHVCYWTASFSAAPHAVIRAALKAAIS